MFECIQLQLKVISNLFSFTKVLQHRACIMTPLTLNYPQIRASGIPRFVGKLLPIKAQLSYHYFPKPLHYYSVDPKALVPPKKTRTHAPTYPPIPIKSQHETSCVLLKFSIHSLFTHLWSVDKHASYINIGVDSTAVSIATGARHC